MNYLTENEKFLLNLLDRNNLTIQEWIELSHQDRIIKAQEIKNKYDLATEWFIIACKLGLVTQKHFNELVRMSNYKYVRLICLHTNLNPNIYYKGESPMLIASYLSNNDMVKILMRRCGGNPGADGLIPEQYDEIYGSKRYMIPEYVPYQISDPDLETFFDNEMEKIKQARKNAHVALYRNPILDPIERYLASGSTRERSQTIQNFNSRKRPKKRSRKRSRKPSRKKTTRRKQSRKKSRKKASGRKGSRKQSRKKKTRRKTSSKKTSRTQQKRHVKPSYKSKKKFKMDSGSGSVSNPGKTLVTDSLSKGEINLIKNTVKKITIPAGTILYRTQDKQCGEGVGTLKDVYDKDTGRMGQYFSDGPIIPYGMIMEYNKSMYLCTFKVVEDINNVLVGKYSFREHDPEHFYETFDKYKEGQFILKRDAREQTSSIDEGLLPLHNYFDDKYKIIKEYEIFLSSEDTNNWQKLQHLKTTELISPEEAQNNIDSLLKI